MGKVKCSDGADPPLPPKLEYVLRQLIWLGAPKAPRLLFKHDQKPEIHIIKLIEIGKLGQL